MKVKVPLPEHINLGKFNFFSTGPVCEICTKVFTASRNLKQHRHTVHEKLVMFSWSEYNYITP